jgi:hypothetical protein
MTEYKHKILNPDNKNPVLPLRNDRDSTQLVHHPFTFRSNCSALSTDMLSCAWSYVVRVCGYSASGCPCESAAGSHNETNFECQVPRIEIVSVINGAYMCVIVSWALYTRHDMDPTFIYL